MSETTIYRLTIPQAKIFNSKKKNRIVNAGRRFGKSWLAGAEIMNEALNNPNKTVIYIAPTLTMARNIMWDTWIKNHIPSEYIVHKNEQLMIMTFANGSKLYCLSAEHPDRLRGLAADFLIVDECAMIDDDFYDVVKPLLADRHHDGKALYISTPQGYNWFYDLFVKGKKNPLTWDCFQFTTLDGGNVTPEQLEEDRQTMSPKMFAQEYLASFETVADRVYYSFDRDLNHCTIDDTWGEGDIHVGMDFNVKPMTAVISVLERGNLYIFDEIYTQTASNTQEVCDMIKNKYPKATVYVYPDPTGHRFQTNAPVGQTDFSILQKNGFLVCAPSHPYSSKDKWNTVNTALCNAIGQRHVFINSDACPELKKSWEGYAFKDGVPDKNSGLDHISDAAAYLICYRLPYFTKTAIKRPKIFGV